LAAGFGMLGKLEYGKPEVKCKALEDERIGSNTSSIYLKV